VDLRSNRQGGPEAAARGFLGPRVLSDLLLMKDLNTEDDETVDDFDAEKAVWDYRRVMAKLQREETGKQTTVHVSRQSDAKSLGRLAGRGFAVRDGVWRAVGLEGRAAMTRRFEWHLSDLFLFVASLALLSAYAMDTRREWLKLAAVLPLSA